MVVVPHKPGTLVERIVILGAPRKGQRVQDLVVEETQSVVPVRVKPVEGAAVADPGDQTAVQVDGCPVGRLVRARYGRVNGQNVLLYKEFVVERDLNRYVLVVDVTRVFTLSDDDPAKVLLWLYTTSKGPPRIVAPEGGLGKTGR